MLFVIAWVCIAPLSRSFLADVAIRCIRRVAGRERESGARRTQAIGRNTVRTTLGRWNGIVGNSAYGTKSGGWRILQTTPWLPANCLLFNHLCLRILANNILLVLLLPLGYKLAHAVRVGKLRSSFIG